MSQQEQWPTTQYGRSLDAMGLERQVDFDELNINFLIAAVVTFSNEEKTGAGWSGKENGLTSMNEGLYGEIQFYQ